MRHRLHLNPSALAALLALTTAAGAAWAAANMTLTLNGNVASSNVRLIGGQAYVPVSDVARALGQKLIKTPGGYEITSEGGANQVGGLSGKVGDTLFDGRWRFQVVSVDEVDEYTPHYVTKPGDPVKPGEGQKLIAIDCLAKNGQKTSAGFYLWGVGFHTALAGADGTATTLSTADFRNDFDGPNGLFNGGAYDRTNAILPGAATKFTLLFKVPKDFTPKDLIVTLQGADSQNKDVRISLAQ